MTTNETDISSVMNDYFVEIGRSLADNIKSNVKSVKYVRHEDNSMFIPHVYKQEVLIAIKTLNKSSSG